ncbi:MAG: hypothetical protein H0X34_08005 [Chthoniobacterales bacterium]|nr:hypothetical protein [Chthoniobacterales bacterium]
MRDPALETDLRLLTLQTESWKKLHSFITDALDKAKPIISADQESRFTEIRSILLQESEHVFEELNLVEALSSKAMNVLQRATSIRGVRELSLDEARRLEIDWNAVFTKLSVVQGQLKARRKALSSRTAFGQSLARIFRQRAASH